MMEDVGRSPANAGSGSCPSGGADKSSPAKPSIPNAGGLSAEQFSEQHAFGRHYERYVIVAWLREQGSKARYKDQRLAALEYAKQIEDGEHCCDSDGSPAGARPEGA